MKNVKISAEDVTVYRKDKVSAAGNPYTRYSTKVSKKKEDGTWIDAFITLGFKKGADIAHKSVININHAFETLDEYNGNVSRGWFVMDYDLIKAGETTKNDEFMNIDGLDEELPFV